MIIVTDNVTRIEGDPKQVMIELTMLLASFKETLRKEYNMTDEQGNMILSKAYEIAMMDNYSRKIMLDELENNGGY